MDLMDLDERIKNSLMILIDKDKAEDFASIVSSLSKSYSMICCFVPSDGKALTESKVFTWETEQELANLVRSYSNDYRIAYVVFHKRLTPNI